MQAKMKGMDVWFFHVWRPHKKLKRYPPKAIHLFSKIMTPSPRPHIQRAPARSPDLPPTPLAAPPPPRLHNLRKNTDIA